MVSKKQIFAGVGILAVVLIGIFIFYSYFNSESFSVNAILLKLNIPRGGKAVNEISIINNENVVQDFKLSLNDFGGFISLSEKEFSLNPGESKKIEIYFEDSKGVVDVYSGNLIIEGDSLVKEVPLILIVEEVDKNFIIIQSPVSEYRNVYSSGKLGMSINIFNVKDNKLHNVKARYFIKDFKGNLIFSDEETLAIKDQLILTKVVNIPKTLVFGDYLFGIMLEEGEEKVVSGYLFNFSEEQKQVIPSSFRFFMIVIMVFMAGILALFFYFIKTRDEVLIQLKKQQHRELQRSLAYMRNCQSDINKLKDESVRARRLQEMRQVKKKIIYEIKTKQKQQRKEIKILKKSGKKDKIKAKLKQWKSQGFKMVEAEKGMKKFSKKNAGKQIKKWRAQGYDTSIFGK